MAAVSTSTSSSASTSNSTSTSPFLKIATHNTPCVSLAVDHNAQQLLLALQSGQVLRMTLAPVTQAQTHKDYKEQTVAHTHGQPHGLAVDYTGRLIICDYAQQALFSLTDEGELATIVNEYEEKAFKGPSSVACDLSSTVYFTDSGHFGETTLQHPRGSIFAIHGETQVLHPIAYECLAHPCGLAVGVAPAHDPSLAPLYVVEMLRNRVLRCVQHPKGVYHVSVFHQFSGGVGPSAIACDQNGNIYVSRFDFAGLGGQGYVTVLNAEGKVLKEITCPGSEVVALAVSSDSLYLSESSSKSVYQMSLSDVFA